jgi:hypothetical protein
MIYYTKAASGRGLSGVKDAEKDRIIHGYQKSLQRNLFAKAENGESRAVKVQTILMTRRAQQSEEIRSLEDI